MTKQDCHATLAMTKQDCHATLAMTMKVMGLQRNDKTRLLRYARKSSETMQ
jgi:phage anti-repressor protein